MKRGKGRGDGKGNELFPLVCQQLDQAGIGKGRLVSGNVSGERKERISLKTKES